METIEERIDVLNKIKEEILDFKESPLYQFRTENNFLPVIGEGDYFAKIMFIGEAPGKNEAITGRPFCGSSGKILDELLTFIEISREKVYITNIVKDRPPENRDPSPLEIALYAPFLDRQIEIIKPQVVVTLGRFSMEYIMKKFGLNSELDSISKIHGKIFESKTSYGKINIIPFYHPAVAVYNANRKDELKKDFGILKAFLV